MLETLESRFRQIAPSDGFCSLRFVDERHEMLAVRQDIPQPVVRWTDTGAMVTVVRSGGMGYAATSDLSEAGLKRALREATDWADLSAGRHVLDLGAIDWPDPVGDYEGPCRRPWESASLKEKFDLLRAECSRLKTDERIVDWEASLWHASLETLYLTNGGGRVRQRMQYLVPFLRATANEKACTQARRSGRSAAGATAGRAGWRCWRRPASTRRRRGSPMKRCNCWPPRTARPQRPTSCSRPTR